MLARTALSAVVIAPAATKGTKTAVNVSFKLAEARRLGATVLAYIRAWDVMRMMVHQEMASVPPPYTLSPSNGGETKPVPVAATAKKVTVKKVPAPVTATKTNSRPVTRKTTAVAARKPVQGAVVKNSVPVGKSGKLNGNGRSANGQKNGKATTTSLPHLLYGDGLLVSVENTAERTAYASYRQMNGSVPPSKTALQTFYQQQA